MMYKAHINMDRVQSCKEHCLNTAYYSGQCLESVGLKNTGYLCGLLHDAGKCTDEFNAYIEAASKGENVRKGSVIHTFAGLRMVMLRYHGVCNPKIGTDGFDNLTAELISIAIGSHHGQFDIYNSEPESGFEHRFKKQPEYDRTAAEHFYNECFSQSEVDVFFKKAKDEISNLYFKIANNLSKDSEEVLFYLGVLERLVLSALIEGDRRDTAEFMSGKAISTLNVTDNTWKSIHSNLMSLLDSFPSKTNIQLARRELSDYCERFADNPCGVYRLNLPTGGGKTLSSLRYALAHAKKYHKKRIIFAVPLLSILDQNAKVIREAVGDESLILEHHSNVVRDDFSPEECTRQEMMVDTWDSPIIITTLVQLLNTMFDGKTSSIRRFHSLSDSVIVIDEVQSVPMKMLSLFNLTVNFLSKICNTTFLLCSATQPLFEELKCHKMIVNKQEAIPISEVRKYKEIFKRTEVQNLGDMNSEEIIEQIRAYYQAYGSVLIVCNTKKEACELFKMSKDITDNCIHLSTAMCMAHRRKRIDEMTGLLKNGDQLICVSTQLIEAGVDVSFGAVIRLAAGIDSITQAAGRANRNGESETFAPVGIVYKKGEDLSRLEEIQRSKDVTGELISEYKKNPDSFDNDLISTASVNFYYRTLFSRIGNIEGYTDYCTDRMNLFDLLSINSKYIPDKEMVYTMPQAFKTAGDTFEVFDNSQTSLMVPYGDGKNVINSILSDRFSVDLSWAKKILHEAKEYTVSLYDYQVKKLNENGAIGSDKDKTILMLNPDYYDEDLGVIFEKGGTSEWNTLIL